MEKYLNIKKEMKNITTEGCDLALELGELLKKLKEKFSDNVVYRFICKNKVKYQMAENL